MPVQTYQVPPQNYPAPTPLFPPKSSRPAPPHQWVPGRGGGPSGRGGPQNNQGQNPRTRNPMYTVPQQIKEERQYGGACVKCGMHQPKHTFSECGNKTGTRGWFYDPNIGAIFYPSSNRTHEPRESQDVRSVSYVGPSHQAGNEYRNSQNWGSGVPDEQPPQTEAPQIIFHEEQMDQMAKALFQRIQAAQWDAENHPANQAPQAPRPGRQN